MANPDGSVEIRIVGSVDPSVTASANQAKAAIADLGGSTTASAAAMSKALQQVGGDLSKVTPAMLGVGAAAETAAAGTATLTAATEGATVAQSALLTKLASGRSVYEIQAALHEVLAGRFSRLAGTMSVEASRLGLLTPLFTAEGAAIAGMGLAAISAAAGVAYLAYQEYEAEKAAGAAAEAFALTGRAAGENAAAIQLETDQLSQLPGVSRKAAEELLNFDAAHAEIDARLAETANQLIPQFVQAFGKEGPAALDRLKQALADIAHEPTDEAIRKFGELNRTFLNLKPAEAEAVEHMIDMGDATGATNRIIQDLAAQGGGNIEGLNQKIAETSEKLEEAKRNLEAEKSAEEGAFDSRSAATFAIAVGLAAHKVAELTGELQHLKAVQAIPTKGEDLADAYSKSHATLLSLRDSATRAKDAVAELHREMAERRQANPQDAEVQRYYANQAKIDRDVERKEDPGDFKKGRTAKGPDIVSEWTEQLHAQEVASGEFFKDQTADELKFWQSKLDLTKSGSKDWLAVQSKIYEAQKTLAHQSYDDQIADFNDKIAADKDNYAKAQQDRQQELAYIQSVHGTESTEYKNFYREIEQAEREHQEKMVEAQTKAGERAVKALKENLDSQMSIMETQANTAKELNAANATRTPIVGGVLAAQKDLAIDQQVAQQKIANEQALMAAVLAADQADMARKEALYTRDSDQWKAANQKKLDDERQFQNQVAQLQAQAVAKQIQDQQKIRSAWHSVIDPMVSTTGEQFKGLIMGTETWGQALRNIESEALSLLIDAIERWVEAQLVAFLTGQAAAETNAKAQVIAYAGVAGAAGVASWAGAPWPIDAGAPDFGEAMVAAALALGAFAQGTNVVPQDMIAQIHAGERIIPAADNRALMQAVNDNRSSSTRGGDLNMSYSPTIHSPHTSWSDLLSNHGTEMEKWARNLMRNGRFG